VIEPRVTPDQLAELYALQLLPGRIRNRRVALNLTVFVAAAESLGVPTPEPEFYFHETREWRFDLSWPEYLVAFELEGGVFSGGRHTRGKGYTEDAKKYTEASLKGWTLIRCTSEQVRTGEALTTLLRAFGIEQERP
jgi:hypothetical protein